MNKKAKKTVRRALALILSLLMCLSLAPNVSYADKTSTGVSTEEALRAAAAVGGEVSLGADITLSSALEVEKNLILDLAGHDLSISGRDYLIRVMSGAKLILKDESSSGSGSIVKEDEFGMLGDMALILVNAGASFELRSGKLINRRKGYANAILSNGAVDIKGGAVYAISTDSNSNACAINMVGSDALNVSGGTVFADAGRYSYALRPHGGPCYISGEDSVIIGANKYLGYSVYSDGLISIADGFFYGTVRQSNSEGYEVSGGYFSSRARGTAEGYKAVELSSEGDTVSRSISDDIKNPEGKAYGSFTASFQVVPVPSEHKLSYIAGSEVGTCETFAEAIAAIRTKAGGSGKINLLANIENEDIEISEGLDITIDLRRNKLSTKEAPNTLTVSGGRLNFLGTGMGSDCYSKVIITDGRLELGDYVRLYNDVEIEGGSFIMNEGSVEGSIKASGNASVEIRGGALANVIERSGNASVSISDGYSDVEGNSVYVADGYVLVYDGWNYCVRGEALVLMGSRALGYFPLTEVNEAIEEGLSEAVERGEKPYFVTVRMMGSKSYENADINISLPKPLIRFVLDTNGFEFKAKSISVAEDQSFVIMDRTGTNGRVVLSDGLRGGYGSVIDLESGCLMKSGFEEAGYDSESAEPLFVIDDYLFFTQSGGRLLGNIEISDYADVLFIGGLLNGKIINSCSDSDPSIIVLGGIFKEDVSKYLESSDSYGCSLIESGEYEGWYEVKESATAYVKKEDGSKSERMSLDDALALAQNGDTVVLCEPVYRRNPAYKTVESGSVITLDLNNNELYSHGNDAIVWSGGSLNIVNGGTIHAVSTTGDVCAISFSGEKLSIIGDETEIRADSAYTACGISALASEDNKCEVSIKNSCYIYAYGDIVQTCYLGKDCSISVDNAHIEARAADNSIAICAFEDNNSVSVENSYIYAVSGSDEATGILSEGKVELIKSGIDVKGYMYTDGIYSTDSVEARDSRIGSIGQRGASSAIYTEFGASVSGCRLSVANTEGGECVGINTEDYLYADNCEIKVSTPTGYAAGIFGQYGGLDDVNGGTNKLQYALTAEGCEIEVSSESGYADGICCYFGKLPSKVENTKINVSSATKIGSASDYSERFYSAAGIFNQSEKPMAVDSVSVTVTAKPELGKDGLSLYPAYGIVNSEGARVDVSGKDSYVYVSENGRAVLALTNLVPEEDGDIGSIKVSAGAYSYSSDGETEIEPFLANADLEVAVKRDMVYVGESTAYAKRSSGGSSQTGSTQVVDIGGGSDELSEEGSDTEETGASEQDSAEGGAAGQSEAEGTNPALAKTAEGLGLSYEEAEKYAREAVSAFTDVEDYEWYPAAIGAALEKGLMQGTGKRFRPKDNATREQAIAVLHRLASASAETTSAGQSEAEGVQASEQAALSPDTSDWAAADVLWAIENGISDGKRPLENITREQFVTMLYRLLVSEEEREGGEMGLAGYEDSSNISDWAYEAFEWAVRKGIIEGFKNGNLQPQGLVSRAQLATMLVRIDNM